MLFHIRSPRWSKMVEKYTFKNDAIIDFGRQILLDEKSKLTF